MSIIAKLTSYASWESLTGQGISFRCGDKGQGSFHIKKTFKQLSRRWNAVYIEEKRKNRKKNI